MKKLLAILLVGAMVVGMVACGGNGGEESNAVANLEGTCIEILDQIYANAELDADFVEALQYYDKTTIPTDDAEMKAWMIGTSDVNFTDSAYSAPMMSSVAYQCILLRLEEGADVEAAKQTILDNADPVKWVCVEAEKVVVTNVGDVVLFVMADEATATAIETAFLALGE
ncbi:MAG: hypothetical protein IJZ23_04185 [Roseburia sp.]|nr:hypothetical protein [Roseburia sp.]